MSPFIVVFAVLIVVLSVLPGFYLWWPSRGDSAARSDLGVALMTGALIALAVLGIQVLIDQGIRQREEDRQALDAQRSFELQLNLQDDLTGIKLDGRDLREFYLYEKVLENAKLNDTDLTGAILSRANLASAELRRANLAGASLNAAVLRNAKLERANLDFTILESADLYGAILAGATVTNTDFTSANLAGVDFRGANMQGASLAGANLIGSDMTGARVNEETTFAEAFYDKTTIFPRGVVQDPCPRGQCAAH